MVATAAVGAVVALPALLAALGHRVDQLQLWHRRVKPVGEGFWHRVATSVMGRPWPVMVSVILLLLVLGAPFLGVHFGLFDERVLPSSNPSRQVSDHLRGEFPSNEAGAISVVLVQRRGGREVPPEPGAVAAYAAALSQLPDVSRVDGAAGSWLGGLAVVGPGPASARVGQLVGSWSPPTALRPRRAERAGRSRRSHAGGASGGS